MRLEFMASTIDDRGQTINEREEMLRSLSRLSQEDQPVSAEHRKPFIAKIATDGSVSMLFQ
jgi:hypothetical protein